MESVYRKYDKQNYYKEIMKHSDVSLFILIVLTPYVNLKPILIHTVIEY